MKPNVDLTESRMFTTWDEPELTGMAKLLWECTIVTKPWDFEHNSKRCFTEDELERFAKKRGVYPTGNKRERKIWRLEEDYASDKVCDCCGMDRGRKPWARKKCNCYSMSILQKIPWDF